MPSPSVSIITVVYNGADSIESTILSVVNQTNQDREYIIIDGGSTDGTIDIIKKYESRIDYWTSERDEGIYDAMNKGIDKATGEWINFMNCGDRFATDETLTLFAIRPEGDILFGDAIVEYGDFEVNFKTNALRLMWKYSPFCHQASFARATLMKQYKFDLQFKIGADHNFFYRAYKSGKTFTYLPRVICYFDGRQGATKRRIVEAIQDKKNIALRYDYSVWKALYFTIFLIYIHSVMAIKKILGPDLTVKLTRMIKT